MNDVPIGPRITDVEHSTRHCASESLDSDEERHCFLPMGVSERPVWRSKATMKSARRWSRVYGGTRKFSGQCAAILVAPMIKPSMTFGRLQSGYPILNGRMPGHRIQDSLLLVDVKLARETKKILGPRLSATSPFGLRAINPFKEPSIKIPAQIMDEMSLGNAVKLIPVHCGAHDPGGRRSVECLASNFDSPSR